MGASRHRRHGVHGVGLGHGAARTNGRSRGHVRRVRARSRTQTMARRALAVVGLGLAAGAVFACGGEAQATTRVRRDTLRIPVPPRADSLIKKDSAARGDTTRTKAPPRDTIKAPLARGACASTSEIATVRRWNRADLFATGALTVADLLERLPGMTTLRGGWIQAPALGAYLGDVRRVRVFYDGMAIDGLDPHGNALVDLSQINLWSAEEACVEQTASEVRVYLRSWRVTNTTASTRTDIATGDQQTNLYRGFFGKRYDGGQALQFAAQQYGVSPPSALGANGDQLGLLTRVGWARPGWSVDGFLIQTNRHRGVIIADKVPDSLPTLVSQRRDAYLRVGVGDPDTSARWL